MIKVLIAARSGSVRVKNKNIRPFSNKSLLEIKIDQLKQVKNIDGIVVNSNDDKILEIASSMDVEIVKREEQYASNEVSMSEVYENMAMNMKCDNILYANCTSPLVNAKTYENAIEMFNKTNNDSLNSVTELKQFVWFNEEPLNYDPLKQPRSQDLPDDLIYLNFALNIISKDNMILYKNIIGIKPFLYRISELESIDIDTELDFFIAEKLYDK